MESRFRTIRKPGRPCEVKLIEKAFKRLKEQAGLPDVVFHSLRHSSAAYKLKLNHGDIKATQGDTGHAQADDVEPADEGAQAALAIIRSEYDR